MPAISVWTVLLKKAPISLIPSTLAFFISLKEIDIVSALATAPPNPIQNIGDKNRPLKIEPNNVFSRAMYNVLVNPTSVTTERSNGKLENPQRAPGIATGSGKKLST